MIMNGQYIIVFILSVYVLKVLCVSIINPEIENVSGSISLRHPGHLVNSILYKVVNKYHCSAPGVYDSHLLVFGSKAWNFPPQDINVTLSYPTDTTRISSDHFDDYIITGFKVHLYIDGSHSNGYITKGGILHESITLSFVTSNVTVLWYQFWLYGVPKNVGIGGALISSAQNKQIKC